MQVFSVSDTLFILYLASGDSPNEPAGMHDYTTNVSHLEERNMDYTTLDGIALTAMYLCSMPTLGVLV